MRERRRMRWRRPGWRAGTALCALAAILAGAPGCEAEEEAGPPRPAPTPTEVHVVDAVGYHVLVREFGPRDGPPVVLLHGFKRNGWSFLPLLPALERNYRLVVPDLPGHGETYPIGMPPGGTESAPPFALLGDVVVAVADRLGLDRFAIVGHSLGGVVAAQVAVRHPGRVAALVLLESTPTYQWEKAHGCRPGCEARLAFENRVMRTDTLLHGDTMYKALWGAYTKVDATDVFKRDDLPILWVMNTDRERGRDAFLAHAARVDPKAPDRVELVTVERRGHFPHWTATDRVIGAVAPFLDSAMPPGPATSPQ